MSTSSLPASSSSSLPSSPVPPGSPLLVDPGGDGCRQPGPSSRGVRIPGRWRTLSSRPLVRRVTGYSAGSVIAAITSEAAFAVAYGWMHSGTAPAAAAGFVGGAIPNYILNRRWAWQDRRGRDRGQEILLYALVSVVSFLVSVVVTDVAEDGARSFTASGGWRVMLVALAYLGVSGLFFVAKFVAYELVVFTKGHGPGGPGDAPSDASPTTS